MSDPLPANESTSMEFATDEEREDYLDYCAAAEALEEALKDRELTPLEDFIEELGLSKDLGL